MILALVTLLGCGCTPAEPLADVPEPFRIAVLADPHIPDSSYAGPEANELDTASILAARERFIDTRAQINALDPAPEFVVILGDLVHTSESSAFADMAELLEGFEAPVHVVFGERDYGLPERARAHSHELFAEFYGVPPYTAFEHGGWKFILANTQLGASLDPASEDYNPVKGSYGPQQLDWIAGHLFDRMPTVFFSHFPIPFETAVFEQLESPSRDIFTLMTDHRETVKLALAGHLQRWVDYRIVAPVDVFVLGATRYDSDNFLVIELDAASESYEILDLDKVHWQTPEADGPGF